MIVKGFEKNLMELRYIMKDFDAFVRKCELSDPPLLNTHLLGKTYKES